jgi:lysophospholipase L1-like esterase
VHYFLNHKLFIVCVIVALFLCLVVVLNVIIITVNGKPVAAPDIPRHAQMIGSGKPLSYAILGDSTAIGQGGEYQKGIASETARYLAQKGYLVTYQNMAKSGARVADVLHTQVKQVAALNPDVVLIAVGANDVTHFTRLSEVKRNMAQTIDQLQAANPRVRIVLTGSPEMGSVPRFPQPTKYLAHVRTQHINAAFDDIAADKGIMRAHIAEETGSVFMKHPELFAADKFHPRDKGYALWFPVLNAALAEAAN